MQKVHVIDFIYSILCFNKRRLDSNNFNYIMYIKTNQITFYYADVMKMTKIDEILNLKQ